MTTTTALPVMSKAHPWSTIVVGLSAYAAAELIHHGLLGTYVLPWLLSMGLSASMAAYIVWAATFLAVAAIMWLIWKFFVSSNE